MKNVTTYVGIDAHKQDLFFAMLVGTQMKPVTWTSQRAARDSAGGPQARARGAGSGTRVL